MRLMLGYCGDPQLLVEVDEEDYKESEFRFRVINGAWYGVYSKMFESVYVEYTGATIFGVKILTDNQDRLRSEYSLVNDGYSDVFSNFDNPNYVAPKPKKVELPANWDNDIAF